MSPGVAIIDGEQQLTFSGQSDSQPALFLGRSFGQEVGCGRSFRGNRPRPWSHQPLVLPTLASVVGLRPESCRSELPFPQDLPPTLGSTLRQRWGRGRSDAQHSGFCRPFVFGGLCYRRKQGQDY